MEFWRGTGFEICRNLAGAGCAVLLGARNAERGQQAIRQFEQARLDDVHFVEIDVKRQHTITAAAQQIEGRYGRLDILVNNAGAPAHKGWTVQLIKRHSKNFVMLVLK